MNSRLINWLAAARIFFAWHAPKVNVCKALAILTSIGLLRPTVVAQAAEITCNAYWIVRPRSCRSSVEFASQSGSNRARIGSSRAFRIAALSNRELYRLMETRPAPDLATISGKWNGINKGVGSAMFGFDAGR